MKLVERDIRLFKGRTRCVEYILSHPELQVEDLEFDAWCDKVIAAQELAKHQFNG